MGDALVSTITQPTRSNICQSDSTSQSVEEQRSVLSFRCSAPESVSDAHNLRGTTIRHPNNYMPIYVKILRTR